MNRDVFLNQLHNRLLITIWWCSTKPSHSKKKTGLFGIVLDLFGTALDWGELWRSNELRPVSTIELQRRLDDYGLLGENDRVELVERVCALRENLFNQTPHSFTEPTASGRLLVYDPDVNLCCGAAEAETYGFLDEHNMPPWDTWIAFIPDSFTPPRYRSGRRELGYLLSWVPDELVDFVEDGITVNPEGCIYWSDNRHENRQEYKRPHIVLSEMVNELADELFS